MPMSRCLKCQKEFAQNAELSAHFQPLPTCCPVNWPENLCRRDFLLVEPLNVCERVKIWKCQRCKIVSSKLFCFLALTAISFLAVFFLNIFIWLKVMINSQWKYAMCVKREERSCRGPPTKFKFKPHWTEDQIHLNFPPMNQFWPTRPSNVFGKNTNRQNMR